MEEIEQILNECGGHMDDQEYRDLLADIITECNARIDALNEDGRDGDTQLSYDLELNPDR